MHRNSEHPTVIALPKFLTMQLYCNGTVMETQTHGGVKFDSKYTLLYLIV